MATKMQAHQLGTIETTELEDLIGRKPQYGYLNVSGAGVFAALLTASESALVDDYFAADEGGGA